MLFPELSPESRVWIYTSDRPFSDEERILINHDTDSFIRQWAAHGDKLFGDFTILENRFLVLCVDESKVPASGCSIDTSVHFIKTLGQKIGVDFFNRLNFYIDDAGEIKLVHFADIRNFSEADVFNSLASSNLELSNNWRKKANTY